VIRFSASLVVVGVGLLIAGGVTSKLLLIYIAIGVSAVALLFLILGAILHRAELFGREPEGIAVGHDGYADELGARPEAAPAAAAAPAPAAAGQGPERREARPAGAGAAGNARNTGSQPLHTFAGYEQFTTQAERRRPGSPREDRPSRPSQPSRPARSQPPFVDPQPTRMDWAADLRKAEKQELDRQERERQDQGQRSGRADVPTQRRPERGRPDRSQPAKPFVEPEPTRMDWAKNLRQAEKQELDRQASDREARPANPGPSPSSPSSPSSPQRTPEPGPAEATRAERIQQPAPSAQATRAERVQQPAEAKPAAQAQPAQAKPAPATRAERVQQPADATRAEKIIAAKPEDKTAAAATDQPPAASAAAEEAAATKAEDKKPAATASAAPPKEDQKPAADSGEADAATETKSPDAATETKSPAETAESDDAPKPSTGQEPSDRGGDTSRDGVPSDQDVTVVPGVPRYHRSECILIRFMGDNDLQRMPVEQARKAGCTPCRACQPDGEEDD
jgi:hypothetical protein